MRRTSFALMALAFLLSAGAVEAQTLKIAYINSQEILLQAPGAEEAQQAFDAERRIPWGSNLWNKLGGYICQ